MAKQILDIKTENYNENYFGNRRKVGLDLETAKFNKILDLHEKNQSTIDNLKSKCANYEVETWKSQEAEWKSWILDDTIKTPSIDAIASGRGIEREELLEKIGNKVLFIYSLLGSQQSKEELINNCTTIKDLEAIKL